MSPILTCPDFFFFMNERYITGCGNQLYCIQLTRCTCQKYNRSRLYLVKLTRCEVVLFSSRSMKREHCVTVSFLKMKFPSLVRTLHSKVVACKGTTNVSSITERNRKKLDSLPHTSNLQHRVRNMEIFIHLYTLKYKRIMI